MKEIINSAFYKKYEKTIKKIFVLLILLIVIFLLWFLFIKNVVTFKSMEKEMTSSAKMYFEKNLNKYPKEENEISKVSLQVLYDRKLISSLYIPEKKKLCSTDNSWVKVKKTKKGYEYFTYLECGRYKSSTDHEGPEIHLNGNKTMNLEYGSSYKELGVKSVVDNKDGKMDVKKVLITGKVDTKKIGTYKIKYVVFDSLKNKTTIYRNVKVVKTLNFIAKTDNKDGIYRGGNTNNYVLYSGMLWRIVKANNDGTVKMITNDTLANVAYQTGMEKEGYVYNWLNDYFYKKLYNPKDYIAKSTWCNDTTDNVNDKSMCKNESDKYNVGLIALSDYNQSIKNGDTYLKNGMTYWTMTPIDEKNTWATHDTYTMTKEDSKSYNGIRPVINIKKGISIMSGEGTYNKPYILEGYKFGKAGQKLSTRISGEYVKYSGYLWRIMGTDNDGNIEVVMDNVLQDGNENTIERGFGSTYNNKAKKFDIKNKENIGYILNNELKDYLITKKMVKSTYEVNYYKNGLLDEKAKNTKVNCLLSIPDISEIFSIGSSGYGQDAFYIRNTLDSKEKILVVNGMTQTDEFYNFVFEKASIKVVTHFDKETKIKAGKGTRNDPYELR